MWLMIYMAIKYLNQDIKYKAAFLSYIFVQFYILYPSWKGQAR